MTNDHMQLFEYSKTYNFLQRAIVEGPYYKLHKFSQMTIHGYIYCITPQPKTKKKLHNLFYKISFLHVINLKILNTFLLSI